MDYKKAYEEALNRAKCLYEQRDFEWSDKDIEQIFPELKESDDEKTRKELIERLKWELDGAEQQDAAGCSRQKDIEMFKRGIAWLEKQKPIKWTSEDEANMDAVWKACGHVYGIKYQGILGDWLKTLRPHENKNNKEYEGGYIDLTIAAIEEYYGDKNPLTSELVSWLEKQGKKSEYDPYKVTVESIADMCKMDVSSIDLVDFYGNVKVKCKEAIDYDKTWIEKQGEQNLNNQFTAEQASVLDKHIDKFLEQKSIDESEPKFKVGDWVIVQDKIPCQIEKVTKLPHNHYQYWTIDRYWFGDATVVRLWTIQDAKDGDVLVGDDKRPFIFKGLLDIFHPECPVAYCGIDSTRTFSVSTAVGWWTDKEVQPATKEQRDLLFQKMKEAGYEWDAENKKLKKIEQKLTWSEEDEYNLSTIIGSINYDDRKNEAEKSEQVQWLKSLKPQSNLYDKGYNEGYSAAKYNHWKPSEEQMEIIDMILTNESMDDNVSRILRELKEQLKKL